VLLTGTSITAKIKTAIFVSQVIWIQLLPDRGAGITKVTGYVFKLSRYTIWRHMGGEEV
jgi:hypothetical protein